MPTMCIFIIATLFPIQFTFKRQNSSVAVKIIYIIPIVFYKENFLSLLLFAA